MVIKKSKNQIDRCKSFSLHEDKINMAKKKMPHDDLIFKTGEFFKILGDPTRLKIINSLFYSELCVCDLSNVLSLSLSAISHQLRVLKQADLIKSRKEGKNVFYSLADEHVRQIFYQGTEHIKEHYNEKI